VNHHNETYLQVQQLQQVHHERGLQLRQRRIACKAFEVHSQRQVQLLQKKSQD